MGDGESWSGMDNPHPTGNPVKAGREAIGHLPKRRTLIRQDPTKAQRQVKVARAAVPLKGQRLGKVR